VLWEGLFDALEDEYTHYKYLYIKIIVMCNIIDFLKNRGSSERLGHKKRGDFANHPKIMRMKPGFILID